MSPGGPILVSGAAVRVGDVGGAVVEALRGDLSVLALVGQDDERVDASRATGAEVVVAPRPAFTGSRLGTGVADCPGAREAETGRTFAVRNGDRWRDAGACVAGRVGRVVGGHGQPSDSSPTDGSIIPAAGVGTNRTDGTTAGLAVARVESS